MNLDLDAIERAARAGEETKDRELTRQWRAIALDLIARLRAAEARADSGTAALHDLWDHPEFDRLLFRWVEDTAAFNVE